ncbi:Microvitellogenin [Papilio machaon]|uniref:Microvitellogenin n=1 Tax=Papilio machaon TaxID=76193 RepID=A0A194QYV5_PAPMA|nr:Microvitellogenin [Papilio machaon]
MTSLRSWRYARPPNYDQNIDKMYPYSEVPFLGDYNLVKIPISYSKLIDHIDYWGEGKISVAEGCTGFADCYNINEVHQLVSKGPDTNRKIPNRIPVISSTNCDTSGYIKNDSVKLVTVLGAPINDSCAKDIARIINKDVGKVVVFGFKEDSTDIKTLEEELTKKNMIYCEEFVLPIKVLGLTMFNNFRAYLNFPDLCNYLYKNVVDGNYENAILKSKIINESGNGSLIFDVITKLLVEGNKNIMTYAYQLWHLNCKDIVTNYFPLAFQTILKEEYVVILNKKYNLALKLDAHTDSYNDRLAWGDGRDKTSERVKWKFAPVLKDDCILFKIMNKEHGLFLKLDVKPNKVGDRPAWGGKNTSEERFEWILNPIMINYDLMFLIINKKYDQGLKMDSNMDEYHDRLLWGHNGSVLSNPEEYGWYIQ